MLRNDCSISQSAVTGVPVNETNGDPSRIPIFPPPHLTRAHAVVLRLAARSFGFSGKVYCITLCRIGLGVLSEIGRRHVCASAEAKAAKSDAQYCHFHIRQCSLDYLQSWPPLTQTRLGGSERSPCGSGPARRAVSSRKACSGMGR
jgi:hypothetical protein